MTHNAHLRPGQFVIGERQGRLIHLLHQAPQDVWGALGFATGTEEKHPPIARRVIKSVHVMCQVTPALERRVERRVVARPHQIAEQIQGRHPWISRLH